MAKMETAIARAEEAANENRRLVKTVTLTLNQIIANGGADEEEEHESSNQSNQDQN